MALPGIARQSPHKRATPRCIIACQTIGPMFIPWTCSGKDHRKIQIWGLWAQRAKLGGGKKRTSLCLEAHYIPQKLIYACLLFTCWKKTKHAISINMFLRYVCQQSPCFDAFLLYIIVARILLCLQEFCLQSDRGDPLQNSKRWRPVDSPILRYLISQHP